MVYQVEFRNKMFGYGNKMTLNKKFKTKKQAVKWVKKNKEDYIDRIRIHKKR